MLITYMLDDMPRLCSESRLAASSKKGFEDAIARGIERANKTLKNVKSAWIENQEVLAANGKVTEYRVQMKVTFILDE